MAGIADVTRYARGLGDVSAIGNPAMVPQRFLINRPIGWAGGRVVGSAKKYFGVIGLIAVAEFFSALARSVKYNASQDVYFGSMASYAMWVDRGWTHPESGTSVAPYPFFSAAVQQAQAEMMGLGGFSSPYNLRAFNPNSGYSPKTRIRSGVYEGQKFLGDFGQFYKDSSLSGMGGRVVRREAGRQVSGLLFNSLKARKNPMIPFVEKVLKYASRNLEGKERSGILKASLAYGMSMEEFEDNSIKQIMRQGAKAGLSDTYLQSRIAGSTGYVNKSRGRVKKLVNMD